MWGHGPYNGESKIIDNSHANFKVQNIKPGQYVAARVIFDNSLIFNSTKSSKTNAKEIIFAEEDAIFENKQEKELFTTKMIWLAIGLLIYWIVLMLVFEKDKKYTVMNVEEERIFEKYNPMLAGCLQGSRTILARDIIAVILNLIDKKIIQLGIVNKLDDKENYKYIISKNEELENQMDEIEKFVYSWVFQSQNIENLQDRLTEMPKEKSANKKFKELSKMVDKELSKRGANKASVPVYIQILNVFIAILSITLIIKHVLFVSFDVYNVRMANIIIQLMIPMIIYMLPAIMIILCVPMYLFVSARHIINRLMQKITGQRSVITAVSIMILFIIIILITALYSPVKYIIADELVVCIVIIILLTDNLMLKNRPNMIEDYSKLNMIKDKIEQYSMMEDRDIEQIILWNKYLSYAVSFGIADKIIHRIKGLYIDENLIELINNKKFNNIIFNNYFLFYEHASLDKRFVRSYIKITGKVLKSSGGSSGRGGGFSGGGGYSGGGGSRGGGGAF